jgi:hypothetical protein
VGRQNQRDQSAESHHEHRGEGEEAMDHRPLQVIEPGFDPAEAILDLTERIVQPPVAPLAAHRLHVAEARWNFR